MLEAWERPTKVTHNTDICGRHAHAGIIAAHQGQAKSLITSTSTAAVADVDMLQQFFCLCNARCTPETFFDRSKAVLRFSKETRQRTPRGSTCHPTISHRNRDIREKLSPSLSSLSAMRGTLDSTQYDWPNLSMSTYYWLMVLEATQAIFFPPRKGRGPIIEADTVGR